MEKNTNIALVEKHCADKDMYDDNGYCDNKIHKFGVYYTRICPGGGDTHCPECMAQMLIEYRETDHEYSFRDLWRGDFERIIKKDKENGEGIFRRLITSIKIPHSKNRL